MINIISEEAADYESSIVGAIESAMSGIWTAIPCIVQSFDASAVTIVAQPTIKGIVTDKDNKKSSVNLPLLPDVPVIFPRGGGCTLTFPIAVGDECLVIFASRCIDAWWQSGGIQMPMDARHHDLSDGFAIVGPMSQARKIGGISTSNAQLRSDDGSTYVELDPAGQVVNIVAPGGVLIDAPTVTITGNTIVEQNLTVEQNTTVEQSLTYLGGMTGSGGSGGSMTINGNVNFTGTVSANGKNIGSTHTHSGVTTGGGTTGAPT